MSSNNRYSLCPPVKGGIQFWEINDMEKMFALVSISVHYPNAEDEAKRLYAIVTEQA